MRVDKVVGRTHLVSPGMAIAAAIKGRLTDVEKYRMEKFNNLKSVPSYLSSNIDTDMIIPKQFLKLLKEQV